MANEARFYHLQTSTLEDALPLLLQRTLERGWKAVVKASSPERVDALNQHLWTYAQNSFLPHGAAKDGDAAAQPVWLTDVDENPNQANVLFLVDGAVCDKPDAFELICLIFDGNDPTAMDGARADWKSYKALNITQTYWQQTDSGGWSKKDL